MASRNRSVCLRKRKQASCRKQMWSDHQKSCWLHNSKGKFTFYIRILWSAIRWFLLKWLCCQIWRMLIWNEIGLEYVFNDYFKIIGICRPIGHSIFGNFGQKRNKCRTSIHDNGRWNKKSSWAPGAIWTRSSWRKSQHRINACSKTRRIRMLLMLIS